MRLALLLACAACAPEPSEVAPPPEADASFTDEGPPPGGEQFVITTESDDVDLGLTDEVLYVRLNPDRLAEVEREMAAEVESEGGIGGFIAQTVTDAVGSALRHRVQFDLADVRDVRYEGGRLEIALAGDERLPQVENDGVPLEEAFAPDDARRFADAFQRVKAER